MPRLTEQEQQVIVRFIEADRPLPEKYRFLLFEEKRDVELVWNGKTNEVCNIVLLFQVIEQVDEPQAKGIDIAPKYIPAEVFDKRAVEKNQVVFHDVSYIEVKPLINAKKRKHSMVVDFNFESKREIIRMKNENTGEWEEQWTGDYIFENE